MAELKGDATPEEAKEQLLKDLRGRIASAGSNPVSLSADEATVLLEAAGGSMEADDDDAPAVAPQSYAEYAEREHPAPTEEDKTKQKAAAAAAPGMAQQTSAKKTRAQLNEMTKEELVEYADDNDIDVTPSWSKADIVDAIAKHK